MQKDRRLQTSMFLSETSGTRQSFDHGTQQNIMKKSATFNSSVETFHQPYFLSTNHPQHLGNTPRPIHMEGGLIGRPVEVAIGQMNERIEQLSKIIDRHEYQLNSQANGNIKSE